MRLALLTSCALLTAFVLAGCFGGHKQKSATHVYGGNAPSIHFSEEQERAGGPVRTY